MISPFGALMVNSSPTPQASATKGYRPSSWAKHVPSFFGIQDVKNNVYYFFDGVNTIHADLPSRMTEHPIQTGANVVDHKYRMPRLLSVEVVVSESMDQYGKGGQTAGDKGTISLFSEGTLKSWSAFQKLQDLKDKSLTLTIITRLYTYENMQIINISVPQDYTTAASFKATVTFKELMTAQVPSTTVSTKKQTTDKTPKGGTQPTKPTATQQATADVKRYGGEAVSAASQATSALPNKPSIPGLNTNIGKGSNSSVYQGW